MIEELTKKALGDEYLKKLISKVEMCIAEKSILQRRTFQLLTDLELSHLIRFADILATSNKENARNLSYKILSLLYEYNKDIPTLKESFRAILTKLGNFPAITLLQKINAIEEYGLPMENKYEEDIKRILQKVPNSEFIFTDSQFEIFEALKSNKHFSFSGPTSLGKSFIIESFIKFLIFEKRVTDNIAILVPTRALINQNLSKFKEDFSDNSNYEILSHPKIPQYVTNRKKSYIFIFTPERLISYISEKNNPPIEYLFVDEAHKIISEKDTRNPLYYHAILQAQKKSIKLYFASPNISNPEIYLKLFDRSTDEALYTTESPVSQNKYFLNLAKQELEVLGEYKNQKLALVENKTLFEWITTLSKNNNRSIIYCNSKKKTREHAFEFASTLKNKHSENIDHLVKLIQDTIHEEYFLIYCLKKGVGFHFGDLPQRVRIQIEDLFKKGEIDYLFCTSTLLEGVNLPAKNIFVLSDKIGPSNFRKVDFLNLIGRAGRLSKEFSGNIIVVKEKYSKEWDKSEKLEKLISDSKIPKAKSQILQGQRNFYENVYRTLEDKGLTNKNTPNYSKEILEHYSNIALIHTIEQTGSILLNTLLKEKPASASTLENKTLSNKVPTDILRMSSAVNLKYQNRILNQDKDKLIILSDEPTYGEILQALNFLYINYNWGEEEIGRGQILKLAQSGKHHKLLEAYAVLIKDWMDSKPLKYLISKSIDYQHSKKLDLFDENNNNLGTFNKYNPNHINIAINKLLNDIENLLRFRFMKYFNNYYLLLKHSIGEKSAGSNWADFLEYGSTKKEVIELQNTGLPRHVSNYLFNNFMEYIKFDQNGNLVTLDSAGILNKISNSEEDIDIEIREFYA